MIMKMVVERRRRRGIDHGINIISLTFLVSSFHTGPVPSFVCPDTQSVILALYTRLKIAPMTIFKDGKCFDICFVRPGTVGVLV